MHVYIYIYIYICICIYHAVHLPHQLAPHRPPRGLNTDEFIPHEAGSPFGWIEPEIAQDPKST